MDDLLYSFGTSHPGAIVLHNFPRHLQHFERSDGSRLDVAAVDVLRRASAVCRATTSSDAGSGWRRPVTFEDLSADASIVADLRRVYGDVEAVDLMIGLFAEQPPPGFAFSDTAFRVFVLMASRRLKSDRFFTYDYRPEVYTPEGLEWVASNTMTSVLLRHYPTLAPALASTGNAFAPWANAALN